MAFVHVGRRGSGRATRLTRSTAREARPRRRGGDLVRSGAPDMSGISRQSEKPRGIPDRDTLDRVREYGVNAQELVTTLSTRLLMTT